MIALFLSLACAAPSADTWPEFRGPTGDGIAHPSAKPPTIFGEKQNLKWKVPFAGKAWSSPVVWGSQVWYTTATETGTAYSAVCLDRETGQVLHDLTLFKHPGPTDIRQYNTYASPTPVIEAGHFYAHFGMFGTACIDTKTGKTVWARNDIQVDHFRGPASSPVLFDGKIFLLFDGFDRQFVMCLNASTGKTIWEKDRDLPYKNSGNITRDNDFKKGFATASVFVIHGQPQLVAPAAMGTIAYDLSDGHELWRVITDGMNQASKPILAHDLIFLTAGHTSTLFAIKTGGSGNITKSHVAYIKPKIAPSRPSPIVVGNDLYFVNDTGVLSCLNAKTGQEKWKESLGEKFSSSPMLANGMLYLAGEAGTVFVVKPGETYELISKNKLDAPIRASPIAVGKDLIIRTYTHLDCFANQ